jgi:hypothetical protein
MSAAAATAAPAERPKLAPADAYVGVDSAKLAAIKEAKPWLRE